MYSIFLVSKIKNDDRDKYPLLPSLLPFFQVSPAGPNRARPQNAFWYTSSKFGKSSGAIAFGCILLNDPHQHVVIYVRLHIFLFIIKLNLSIYELISLCN